MRNGFFPEGMERGEKKLPVGEGIEAIPLRNVKVYVWQLQRIAMSYRLKGDNPVLFIDVEKSHDSHIIKFDESAIHLGIKAQWHVDTFRSENVLKDRIDVYVPISELDNLISSLLKIKNNLNGQKSLF